MTSIFENTHSKVTVHILHDDTLTEDNRQKFIRTAEKYSQGVELHDLTGYKGRLDDRIKCALRHLTIGALYRLCAPDVLPVEKVIYLDCDIVVNLDLSELWTVDVENYCFAGVHMPGHERLDTAVRDKLNGHSYKTHINTGVLIMNLAMLRNCGNLFKDSIEWFLRRRHLVYFGDQDIINGLYYGSIKLIGRKYNNCNPKTENQLADSIIHTPGHADAFRTWGIVGLPSQKLYWKYYLRSAWGEDKTPSEIIDVLMNAVERSSEFYHTSARSCVKRLTRGILRKVFCTNSIVTVAGYLVKDVYYRTKHILLHS